MEKVVRAALSPLELNRRVKQLAGAIGFDDCGVTTVAPISRGILDEWLQRGLHGDMGYLPRQAATRREPAKVWPEASSIVVVLHNYYTGDSLTPSDYRVARYAQGQDYHNVTRSLLDRLGELIIAEAGTGSWRSYVDAGPMPERELAQRAGLGWMGKNTMLISTRIGSFTFIGIGLTDLEIAPDAPFDSDRCGSCTRCLEACPTQAFLEPRLLDARRCISYLTIESRKEIPDDLRGAVGTWLFGCDVCQDVCPWNEKFTAPAREPRFAARAEWPALDELAGMTEEEFERVFGDSAIRRARAAGIRRNARVVRENL